MLAALDLFPSTEHLPVTHRSESRNWRTSQVVPMNGRIIFESLSCRNLALSSEQHHEEVMFDHGQQNPSGALKRFIRINVNDGIVALPACSSGPGSSCPLGEFLGHVRRRGQEVGNFRKICGIGDDAAGRITFLHQ